MIQIALDGPSGAGKSTVAKALAKKLGIVYVDTGALYRTVGYYVRQAEKDPKNADEVGALLPNIHIEIKYENGAQHVILNGEDLGDKIRTPEMSMYASAVSAIPAVRSFLLDTQRDLARKNSVVMDGRDIGTVILPDADVKVFLFASNEARARRRFKELTEKGQSVIYEDKPLHSSLHPTMKPVKLVARFMINSSQRGDVVADIFGGSGTTLIAAEQLGRKCRMMELDPHYVDVIIQRWESLTGEKAVLIDG